MTRQWVFDTVARHLLTQRRKSQTRRQEPEDKTPALCAYRGYDGLKCTIGCLIPDELYDVAMENRTVSTLVSEFDELHDFLCDDILLMQRLQRLHDSRQPSEWEEGLYGIAIAYELLATVLEEFPHATK